MKLSIRRAPFSSPTDFTGVCLTIFDVWPRADHTLAPPEGDELSAVGGFGPNLWRPAEKAKSIFLQGQTLSARLGDEPAFQIFGQLEGESHGRSFL